MGEPFKVGDAVYLVAYQKRWNARPGIVTNVYKTGNFTVEGEGGQFRQGGGRAGDTWATLHVYPATPEMAASVAKAMAERKLKLHIFDVGLAINTAPADNHPAIAALLSDELLALLGVTR